MNIIDNVSSKGDGVVNEDTFGFCSNRCWVIDGVTSRAEKYFYSPVSDAQFFVNNYSDILKNNCIYNEISSNRELLLLSMKQLRNKLHKTNFDTDEEMFQPSFAIAIIHELADNLHVDILSDCYVIIKESDNIKVFTDNRITPISNRIDNNIKEMLQDNDMDIEQANKIINYYKRESRKMMNKEHGYWVGTIDGTAFYNMFSVRLIKANINQILICSDGYFKLFEKNIMDFNDIFSNNISLKDSIEELRKFEKHEDNIDKKKSDDATAIRIVL